MSKLIVIGIDGASPDLMLTWMNQGLLPNFKEIRQKGVFGRLNSVPNQRSAAAWSSFITGVNPGKHGIFEFYERVPLSHNIRFTQANSRDGISFWKYLSAQGKRVIVVNVPMTYPAEEVSGCLISGLDAPGKNSPGFTYPADLLKEIEQKVGPYVQEPGAVSSMAPGQEEQVVEKILKSVQQRGKAVRYLMSTYDWDTMVAVFRETDPAQHCFWSYMDQDGSTLQESILKVYQEIDRELGSILNAAGDDCRLLIMSDHGFGFRQHGNGCLNQWLYEAGFLQFKKGSGRKVGSNILRSSYQLMEKIISRRWKERLFGLVPGLISRVHSKVFFASIDWENTIAYGDNIMPVVWINTTDVNSSSGVPSEEYEKVVTDLKTKLLESCLEVETGEKVVEWVRHRDEIYSGDHVHKAPDLLIRWKESEKIAGLRYGAQGKPIYPRYPTREHKINTGDHRPMGVFMAHGDGIKRHFEVNGLNIVDVTATIIHLNQLFVPHYMEGEVAESIFDEHLRSINPITRDQQEITSTKAELLEYSQEEESVLRDRLRGLGYVE
ncbi:MAG: alkaline phosphatase family protein [Deltaproteobacteria bacterium]|nr:alkaline phosphatase family protein [Deltaproteobacteria bacterium]MBW2140536.1 alkaline phosphatase family protein [Deltaproteobacteria bacterium]MBW2322465.1 alkaline phosphatase family protein [Deltaproteobacteria bacterium]